MQVQEETLPLSNQLLSGTPADGADKERIPTRVFESSEQAVSRIAQYIAHCIRSKTHEEGPFILGLATGSTPKPLYKQLTRLYVEGALSFRNVITFNLDEYYPIEPKDVQSYVHYMHEHFFDHVDIPPENIHVPDGTLPQATIGAYCANYEKLIHDYGGLDLQILGIGRTGHIGFNEPGSSLGSKTRLITLDNITRIDAAGDFHGTQNVPRKAITMGVDTIMNAKEIILMAWGEGKAKIVRSMVEGPETDQIPATFLQRHRKVSVILDVAAASELTRIKTPWLVTECEWTSAMIRKAVVWLCQHLNKPILKLVDRDYNDFGMGDLLNIHGSAYDLNIKVFNELQHTITGWPGGKPGADDTFRPERAKPEQKRVVIFSPHPDDDVISMGGTFIRLHEQGHDVHVAYQTSGDIAVFDHDVVRFIDFYRDFSRVTGQAEGKEDLLYEEVIQAVESKKPGGLDWDVVRKTKALIRKGEAKAACRSVGLGMEKVHFLNLPFYETGVVEKMPASDVDVQITMHLLNEVKPHQIFAAGDLSDPHGTHRVCLEVIFSALHRLKTASPKWLESCYLWLYRGAWQEWDISDIDMAVPLSPGEVIRKRKAIFQHQSQKDTPVFPGSDPREFWQRAEDRNRDTAKRYDQLGLAEYEAIEAFKKHLF